MHSPAYPNFRGARQEPPAAAERALAVVCTRVLAEPLYPARCARPLRMKDYASANTRSSAPVAGARASAAAIASSTPKPLSPRLRTRAGLDARTFEGLNPIPTAVGFRGPGHGSRTAASPRTSSNACRAMKQVNADDPESAPCDVPRQRGAAGIRPAQASSESRERGGPRMIMSSTARRNSARSPSTIPWGCACSMRTEGSGLASGGALLGCVGRAALCSTVRGGGTARSEDRSIEATPSPPLGGRSRRSTPCSDGTGSCTACCADRCSRNRRNASATNFTSRIAPTTR